VKNFDSAGAVGEIRDVIIVRTVDVVSGRRFEASTTDDLCPITLGLDALLLGGAALLLRCL
jgi:hypothetical protein